MLDKFLKKINGASTSSVGLSQKVDDYNNKVIEESKKNKPISHVNWDSVQLPEQYVDNRFNAFASIPKTLTPKLNKIGKNPSKSFSRPNTYNVPQQKNYDNNFQDRNYQREQPQQFQRKQYIDDGSYFCSYAIGGNTLVCYKNKEKVEFLLEGISHPDKNNYLAKRANYFLNDLVKKQKVYIEPTDNGTYNIFLDIQKQNCINTILINEGHHNSEPYNSESKDKKTSFSKYKSSDKNNISVNEKQSDNTEKAEVKEKKNYAYGLFATAHNTFEALFNKEKITLKIDNLDNISKEDKKICKSMIYDFVSKKSIILNFLKEENNIHYVEVYNKEGDCLNNLIEDKHFAIIEIEIEKLEMNTQSEDSIQNIKNSSNPENEQCSQNDWDWVDSDNGAEIEVPEVTNLPAMFKNPIESKPNSPFKKKNLTTDIEKEKVNPDNLSKEEILEEEKNVPDVITLPTMFKNPIESKPNSPFNRNNKEKTVVIADSISRIIATQPEESNIVPKKKLSFGKR